MKKLLLVLVFVVSPGASYAQGDEAESRSFNTAADAFFFRSEVCGSTNASCGTAAGTPTNVINSPNFVKGFVSFRVPTTQTYTVYYLGPDIEGALNVTSIVSQGPVALNAGDTATLSAQFSSLGSGVYKFIAIVIGANGRATMSEPYLFRYCNAACITGP